MKIKVGQIWKHYKDHDCKIIGIGRHTETLEELVFYVQLGMNYKFGEDSVWARPLKAWEEEVEWPADAKAMAGKRKVKRFVLIKD